MRKKHNVEPDTRGGKIECPLSCEVDKFRTHQALRSHLESFHHQVIEKEEQDFPDIDGIFYFQYFLNERLIELHVYYL